jgi:hypothetical protein
MKKIRQYAVVQTTVEACFDRDGRRCELDRAAVTVPAGTLGTVFQISTTYEAGSVYLVFEDFEGALLYLPGEFRRPVIAEQG